jgi:hypothetical protein
MIAFAVRALAQTRHQKRHTEHQQRNRGYTARRASREPHAEDERGKQEREQRRQTDYVMGNTVWIATDILRREAVIVASRNNALVDRHGRPPSRQCAIIYIRNIRSSEANLDCRRGYKLATVLNREQLAIVSGCVVVVGLDRMRDV